MQVNFLKLKRIEKGMNQTAVADLCGVPQAVISLWENGKKEMTPEDITNYCKAVGIEYDLSIETENIPEMINQLEDRDRLILSKIIDAFVSVE